MKTPPELPAPVTLRTATKDGVLRITLDRPEKKNALDLETLRALGGALEAAAHDPAVRVVVLDSSAEVFSAGGDVQVMRDFAGDWLATQERLRNGLNRVVLALRGLPKPVLCAVQGNAYGAGAILAFQCDLTVVAREAQFALSFRHVGLIPDTGGTWLLPRVLGLQRAKHLVWTGAPFSGEDAAAWGLALEAVDTAQVPQRVDRLAAALRGGPAATMALAKHALQRNEAADLPAALEREARTQAAAFLSAEHAEGRDAFFERRRPAWP